LCLVAVAIRKPKQARDCSIESSSATRVTKGRNLMFELWLRPNQSYRHVDLSR
jgi:hypothetical protein